jgi:hypothetical protein
MYKWDIRSVSEEGNRFIHSSSVFSERNIRNLLTAKQKEEKIWQ